MDFTLNKRECKDAIHLRYDWQISDSPSTQCACGDVFDVDHAMVYRRGGFIIQRYNELLDLETEMLRMVIYVQIETVLQEINGKVLIPGTNTAADARLVAFGSFLELGFVTRMQSHVKASPQNKSTASMNAESTNCVITHSN